MMGMTGCGSMVHGADSGSACDNDNTDFGTKLKIPLLKNTTANTPKTSLCCSRFAFVHCVACVSLFARAKHG